MSCSNISKTQGKSLKNKMPVDAGAKIFLESLPPPEVRMLKRLEKLVKKNADDEALCQEIDRIVADLKQIKE